MKVFSLLYFIFITPCTILELDSHYTKFNTYLLRGFDDCHIAITEFGETDDLGEFIQPITRYRLQNFTPVSKNHFIKTVTQLKSAWNSRREKCQVIYLAYPREFNELKILHQSWMWLINCNPRRMKASICYVEHIYYIILYDSLQVRNTSTEYWFVSNVPKFEYYVSQNFSELTLELIIPCYSKAYYLINCSYVNDCQFDVTLRSSMDNILSHLIFYSCPIQWMVMLTARHDKITYLSLYTGTNSTIENNQEKNSLANIPIGHVLENVLEVMNKFSHHYTDIRLEKAYRKYKPSHGDVIIRLDANPIFNEITVKQTYMLFTGESTYNFLTCDGSYSYISFNVLVQVFDKEFWIFGIISLILSGIWMSVMAWYIRKIQLNPILPLVAIMLEQSLQLPKLLRNKCVFRYFITVLLLIVIVISNSYKGKFTSNLTTPMPTYLLTKINEAIKLNFSTLVPAPPNRKSGVRSAYVNTTFLSLKNYIMFQNYHDPNTFVEFWIQLALRMNYTELLRSKFGPVFRSLKIDLGENYSLLSDLAKCDKTITIGNQEYLDSIYLQLKSTNYTVPKPLYFGSDLSLQYKKVLSVAPMCWDRSKIIYSRFQAIIFSGVHNYITESQNVIRRKVKQLYGITLRQLIRNTESMQPLAINSNIMLSLSSLFISLVVISVLTFIIEKLWTFLSILVRTSE